MFTISVTDENYARLLKMGDLQKLTGWLEDHGVKSSRTFRIDVDEEAGTFIAHRYAEDDKGRAYADGSGEAVREEPLTVKIGRPLPAEVREVAKTTALAEAVDEWVGRGTKDEADAAAEHLGDARAGR